MKRKKSNKKVDTPSQKVFITNFIRITKLFKNKPNYLTKFLIDNLAFSDEFIENVVSSEFLNKLNRKNTMNKKDFVSFNEMNEFFNSILKEKISDIDKAETEFNYKLLSLINDEKFEEAAKVRDYMVKNNIKIK